MLNPLNVSFFVVWISLNQEINEDSHLIVSAISYNVFTFLRTGSRWSIITMMSGCFTLHSLGYRVEFSGRASQSCLAVLTGTSGKKQTFKEPVFER